MSGNCIFCKIISGELPSTKVYEDEDVLAFRDINPQADVHFLIIPKSHIESLAHVDTSHAALLGKIMTLASVLAEKEGSVNGFRTIVNTGEVGRQDVFHLHVHVLGGDKALPAMIYKRS